MWWRDDRVCARQRSVRTQFGSNKWIHVVAPLADNVGLGPRNRRLVISSVSADRILPTRGCGVKLGLVYVVNPRLARQSMRTAGPESGFKFPL